MNFTWISRFKSRVVDLCGVDPDPTFSKKSDPTFSKKSDTTFQKNRIRPNFDLIKIIGINQDNLADPDSSFKIKNRTRIRSSRKKNRIRIRSNRNVGFNSTCICAVIGGTLNQIIFKSYLKTLLPKWWLGKMIISRRHDAMSIVYNYHHLT